MRRKNMNHYPRIEQKIVIKNTALKCNCFIL